MKKISELSRNTSSETRTVRLHDSRSRLLTLDPSPDRQHKQPKYAALAFLFSTIIEK